MAGMTNAWPAQVDVSGPSYDVGGVVRVSRPDHIDTRGSLRIG